MARPIYPTTGIPDDANGNDGDFAVDIAANLWYARQSGEWSQIGPLVLATNQPYFTPADYRSYLNKTGTEGQNSDAAIQRSALTSMQHINHYTRRDFRPTANQSITYYPRGRDTFHIDDWAEVTSTLPDGVILHRQNPGWPYEFVQIESGKYIAEFTLEGTTGWAALPPAVQECALELTAVFRLESARAYAQVNAQQRNAAGGQKPTVSELGQQLLEQYLGNYQRIEIIE